MKINDSFSFPKELDMTPYIDDEADHSSEVNNYQLFSVLCHEGQSYGGHYIAFCRPTENEQWFKFNDHEVKAVDDKEAINQTFGGYGPTAYFLSYIRTSEPTPAWLLPVSADRGEWFE